MASGSEITGINHVSLVVADLDRALGFYREGLSLILRARVWPIWRAVGYGFA